MIVVQVEYWLCLVSDAAWIVLDCSTSLVLAGLVSEAGWIVLDCSTSLVLAVPPSACCLDCA